MSLLFLIFRLFFLSLHNFFFCSALFEPKFGVIYIFVCILFFFILSSLFGVHSISFVRGTHLHTEREREICVRVYIELVVALQRFLSKRCIRLYVDDNLYYRRKRERKAKKKKFNMKIESALKTTEYKNMRIDL